MRRLYSCQNTRKGQEQVNATFMWLLHCLARKAETIGGVRETGEAAGTTYAVCLKLMCWIRAAVLCHRYRSLQQVLPVGSCPLWNRCFGAHL